MEVSIELSGSKFAKVLGDKGETDEVALAALRRMVSTLLSHSAERIWEAGSYVAKDVLLGF